MHTRGSWCHAIYSVSFDGCRSNVRPETDGCIVSRFLCSENQYTVQLQRLPNARSSLLHTNPIGNEKETIIDRHLSFLSRTPRFSIRNMRRPNSTGWHPVHRCILIFLAASWEWFLQSSLARPSSLRSSSVYGPSIIKHD